MLITVIFLRNEETMIRIAICDDENVFVSQVENILLGLCKDENINIDIDVFYSGDTLAKEILEGIRYDIIYLDIQMANGDGIGTANKIRNVDENVIFIFISGYDKYMIELFNLDVFSFIRKPIDRGLFCKVFLQAHRKICNRNHYFIFHYKSQEFKILFKDIFYFESRGRHIVVHVRNEDDIIFNDKLSEVEKRIDNGKNPFLRIHQSYLVNYHMIKMRTRTEVALLNGERLPISDDRQKGFGKAYGKLLRSEINV